MSVDSYLREIHTLDIEIKRVNDRAKALRTQKQTAKTHLYNYMKRHNLQQVQDGTKVITINQCLPPKARAKAKPKKARVQEAIELFRMAGIPNPDSFYEEFEATQKAKRDADGQDTVNGEPRKKRGKKDDFDDVLGF